MKTMTLTFTISTLLLGILFFAFQINGQHEPNQKALTHTNAAAPSATDHSNLRGKGKAEHGASNSREDDDAEPIRFLNDGN